MSIGVHFGDDPLYPSERIRQLVEQAHDGYRKAMDERLRLLLDSGITLDRISIVTLDECGQCHGSGAISGRDEKDGSVFITLSECPSCPGICVDGKSIRRLPTRET